mgnify:CR=1 FL=1
MIKLTNIEKVYNEFQALKEINLTIKEGEFTAIVGPSGSGKSTLMHIIGLLDQPTSGKIFINNIDVSKLNDDKLSKLRSEFVGFVFQQFNLINKLTVLENVMLPAIYFKDKKTDFRKKAMELLKRFGIDSKADSYPNKISGGQQQRVAIARSLILSPKLILADEPTGNLDTKNGNQILDLLKELNKKDGVTVIIVTHEPDVAAMCKRQIIVRDGMIA